MSFIERTEAKHHPSCCGGCDECFRVCWGYHGPERRKAERRVSDDEEWLSQLPVAPSPALTREALAAALDSIGQGFDGCHFAPLIDEDTLRSDDLHHGPEFADAILSALGTPPPAGVFVTEADLYYDGKGPDGGVRTREDLGGLVRARFAALSKTPPPTEEEPNG